MSKKYIKYPCETCLVFCFRKFSRAFCSDKCRLLGYTQKTEFCWNWKGMKNQYGYGEIKSLGKVVFAHRKSYEIFKKPINSGMFILHSCDNRACVNPDHLREGTPSEGALDTVNKGRHTKGEKVWKSKLKECDVRKIRLLRKDGFSLSKISLLFNVTVGSISNILNHRTWKHI